MLRDLNLVCLLSNSLPIVKDVGFIETEFSQLESMPLAGHSHLSLFSLGKRKHFLKKFCWIPSSGGGQYLARSLGWLRRNCVSLELKLITILPPTLTSLILPIAACAKYPDLTIATYVYSHRDQVWNSNHVSSALKLNIVCSNQNAYRFYEKCFVE